MTVIEIRRALSEGEAAPLIEEYADSFRILVRDSREAIAGYVTDPKGGIWIAYADGSQIGCILLRGLPGHVRAGEVKRLYVRREWRRHGVAERLLGELESYARTIGFAWLYLDTNDDFPAAIAFYERNGYKRCLRYNQNPQATIFMRKLLTHEPPVIRTFRNGDEAVFRDLNEQWIRAFFQLEPKDEEVLGKPQDYILSQGGHIFIAEVAAEAVGCCALVRMTDTSYEVSKMAVADDLRGNGIGKRLLERVIKFAQAEHIRRLYIETNHTLTNAIGLYRSCGFEVLPPEQVLPSPYARADVFMELWL